MLRKICSLSSLDNLLKLTRALAYIGFDNNINLLVNMLQIFFKPNLISQLFQNYLYMIFPVVKWYAWLSLNVVCGEQIFHMMSTALYILGVLRNKPKPIFLGLCHNLIMRKILKKVPHSKSGYYIWMILTLNSMIIYI